MTQERPTDREPGDSPLDLTLLVAVHRRLREDLQHFVDVVMRTPLEERGTWRSVCERWAVFSAFAQQHHQWERESLWPLVTEGALAANDERAAVVIADMAAVAVVAETLIESCRPVFERLAATRDEDAAATLRVRVRAVSSTVEDMLDGADLERLPLVQQYVPSVEWRGAEERYFADVGP